MFGDHTDIHLSFGCVRDWRAWIVWHIQLCIYIYLISCACYGIVPESHTCTYIYIFIYLHTLQCYQFYNFLSLWAVVLCALPKPHIPERAHQCFRTYCVGIFKLMGWIGLHYTETASPFVAAICFCGIPSNGVDPFHHGEPLNLFLFVYTYIYIFKKYRHSS